MILENSSENDNLFKKLKFALKWALQHVGLYEYYLRIKKLIRMRQYRKIDRFTITLNNITVHYSTEDERSKSWFFPRLAGGNIHEKIVTELLIGALQTSKCFVDIGTYLGWYTCIAAKHMPNGRVYGFEMDDMAFALLKRNININNCTNVEAYNVAVSDSSGVVHYNRKNMYSSPALRLEANTMDDKSKGFISVNSLIMDDFFEKKRITPDIIKIDVEGAEMNVLKGMRQALHEHKPLLFVEIHPKYLHYFNTSVSAILAFFKEEDYKVFEIENLRLKESNKQLRPLLKNSTIEKNTMLYAIPAN